MTDLVTTDVREPTAHRRGLLALLLGGGLATIAVAPTPAAPAAPATPVATAPDRDPLDGGTP